MSIQWEIIKVNIAVVTLLISIVMFFTAVHNIDLVHNRIIILSETGQDFWQATDCNLTGCYTLMTIYMRSMVLMILSFFLPVAILISIFMTQWKKLYLSSYQRTTKVKELRKPYAK